MKAEQGIEGSQGNELRGEVEESLKDTPTHGEKKREVRKREVRERGGETHERDNVIQRRQGTWSTASLGKFETVDFISRTVSY